jgi:hypothetical protein
MATETYRYGRVTSVSAMPAPIRAVAVAAMPSAVVRTPSSHFERGKLPSTRRIRTASFARKPSAFVQNTSATSRRTPRLSTRRVSPPVPGSTPSRGTSGSETTELPSSTSTILSAANASS